MADIMYGLTNYWPIVNDLRDYMGSSDMIPGSLDANETIGFTQDRFNNTNASIYMEPGYYMLPPGIYFNNNSFSFLAWVKILSISYFSRVIDCGNGPAMDNFILGFAFGYSSNPYTINYFKNTSFVSSPDPQPLNTWFHLASVFDGQSLMLYVNGNLVASSISKAPLNVNRTRCYIGRSNWYNSTGGGDPDANACFDDLMLYNRALTPYEIQDYMNYSLN